MIASILYYVSMYLIGQRAASGKGIFYEYGKRLSLRRWSHALMPHELPIQESTGQLDNGIDSNFDYGRPQYVMIITNFGRFLIAPYSPVFFFSSVIRRFRSYQRSSVSMIEILMEPSIPKDVQLFQFPKIFTATLILPDARIRLNNINSGMVEELRR